MPRSSDPSSLRRVDDLYEALNTLPLSLRTPWILHVIEGETLPDVAKMCDLSLATTKRRIAEAETKVNRRLHAT
jgi:RNA polymerase sigma-70 factor (ECF subfamily)